jgi:hypothetical protein
LAIFKEWQGRKVLKGYFKINKAADGEWEDQDLDRWMVTKAI